MAHLRLDAQLGNEARCVTKVGINHPVKITANTNIEDITDVGQQFFVIFVFGLILNLLTAVWSVAACFVSQQNQLYNNILQTIIFLANFVFLMIVSYLRLRHAGKVCSGDYLYYPIQQEMSETGVLGVEGMFLTIFIFTGWFTSYMMLIIIWV